MEAQALLARVISLGVSDVKYYHLRFSVRF
jgi:hypothetical protein